MMAAGNADGSVVLWDTGTDEIIRTIVAHRSNVYSVAFSPDGSRLLSGGQDGEAMVWDIRTGEMVAELKGHSQPIWSVAVSPDGKRYATGSADLTVRLWDASNGTSVLILSELQTLFTMLYSLRTGPDSTPTVLDRKL